jgi:hypothetical protein
MHARKTLAHLLACLALGGCVTLTAPRYPAHVSNTVALRESGIGKVAVGEFRKDPAARGNVDLLRARAMSVASPYGSYTAYLREALAVELDHADRLDPASPLRIDGILKRNDFSGGDGNEYVQVEAELTVSRDGVVVWRGTKSGRHEWRSTFPGDVAIPRAVANYQTGVQRMIAAFIADPAFVAALSPQR